MPKVLVADPIAQDGIDVLTPHAQVDVRLGLSPEELIAAIGEYDVLIVRSETQVTAEVIEAGKKLQVIGRAGVGVDNIDLQTATRRGIIVVNAPLGNTISAAEHTIGLMLALARHIPAASTSLKEGRWERKSFLGIELRGKSMGIVGLGQVGSEVARRARGLEMHVLGCDPFVSEERAHVLGVELVSFEDLLKRSDFISLHTTLTPDTRHFIGEQQLKLVKPSVRIINTARGQLVDEQALCRAIEEGRVAGAAIDVFSQEPPPSDSVLLKNDRILVTPHLGASTAEAQERVAIDVAEQVVSILKGEPALYAVNAPLIPAETMSVIAPYLEVAARTASLGAQLCVGQLKKIEIEYLGEIANFDVTPLKAAVIRGLLAPISEENVTIVNANLVAEHRGLHITERKGPYEGIYANLINVRLATQVGTTTVGGTMAHDGPHVVLLDDFWVDIPPDDVYLLICENEDRPGTIGAIGSYLGQNDVNISFMRLGRKEVRGRALMVLGLDDVVTPAQLEEIQNLPHIFSARLARM
jgi:D-3-phosphoglycerate dehydrogenase / 2-oxoglutarate reductase